MKFNTLFQKIIMSFLNTILTMEMEMVFLVWKICALAMARHWQKKSEDQYEREFREQSWEPYLVYLAQRAQRESWRRFSRHDHFQFWYAVRGFASSILKMERRIKEEIRFIDQRSFCLSMTNGLEMMSGVERLRENLSKDKEEAKERLFRLRRESEIVQVNMAKIMFTAPYPYLRIIKKLVLRRIIQDRAFGIGPPQRIFEIEYPPNSVM